MSVLNEVLNAIKDEHQSWSDILITNDELRQELDNVVAITLSNHDIENDENSICDRLGLDAYHAIRDAQNLNRI